MSNNFELFNNNLETWFSANQRDFPWRKITDPYQIWISEVMSHQTQIDRVAEKFWPRFIEKFPTIELLAKSTWEEVYPVWDGLGYYSRGKNVLKTAKIIVEKRDGTFPTKPIVLESLPGIGKYTAAAICAFAFDEKIPAVDTNISKIISILWPKLDIYETAKILVEDSHSGRMWNSAMMDLATVLRQGKAIDGKLGANFFPEDITKQFLVKRKKPAKNKENAKGRENPMRKAPTQKKFRIEVGIACIWKDGKYLAQTRPEGKSFVGFWEFPGGKREKGETFRDCVKREILEEIGVKVSVRPHFYEEVCKFKNVDLCLRFHRAQIQSGVPKPMENQKIKWVKPEDFFNEKFLPTNHNALRKLQKMRV